MRQRTIRRRQERTAKAEAVSPPNTNRTVITLSLLLVLGTCFLYGAVRTHDFINYDDKDYVIDNPHVTAGLSWETVRWSLTANDQANWHPLTWLSHAMDCQFFGLDAGYHHLDNLILHALNVLLLFLLLQHATGMVGRSFLIAALFAWHPFNVQSVAWVAERKNLLSTLFYFLTIGAYGWYARKPQLQRLAAVIAMFVLALASKPMAVSLPFALLLLDYWPLQRISEWSSESPRLANPQQPLWRLLLEKVPLFVLAAASCVVTVWAQRSGGALRSLETFSLTTRVENALQSYGIYIIRTFWPVGFSVFYPLIGLSISFWKPAAALLLLCAVSVVVWKQRVTRPYLIVGWLWFIGTMVPVIGIVQVGDQAMADRYAYLPLIGLFGVVVWGAFDFFDQRRMRGERWGIAAIALAAIFLLSLQQIGYWQNSTTLWSQALRITDGNLQVEKQLANALVMSRDTEHALPHLINIVRLDPKDTTAHVNLGACFAAQGQIAEATREFARVVQLTDHKDLDPDDRKFRTSAFLNLGFAYVRSRDYPNALLNLRGASDFDPPMVDKMITDFESSVATQPSEGSYLTLSLLLRARGKDAQATSILEDAVKGNSEYVNCKDLLDYLNSQPKLKEYSSGSAGASQHPS
jgi:tetratricopeptide (TPR) repeat protein